jgi:hypothetical protein
MYWSATDRWKLREATADASLRQRLAAVVRSVPDVKDLDDRMVVVGRHRAEFRGWTRAIKADEATDLPSVWFSQTARQDLGHSDALFVGSLCAVANRTIGPQGNFHRKFLSRRFPRSVDRDQCSSTAKSVISRDRQTKWVTWQLLVVQTPACNFVLLRTPGLRLVNWRNGPRGKPTLLERTGGPGRTAVVMVASGLVGDIGATNARFGLVDGSGRLTHPRVLLTEEHGSLGEAVVAYLADEQAASLPSKRF